MTAITTPGLVGQRDEIYFWDNVCFSVKGVLFKVPRFPFIVGSDYFADKYGLSAVGEHGTMDAAASVTQLDGVPVEQFRLFLKLLLPLLPHSIAPKFTTDEWLSILELATLWHFHDIRNLAIQHLDSQLTDLGFVRIGRAIFDARWVLEGYKWLILRPKSEIIEQAEADAIGHETACKLWIIRYQCRLSGAPPSMDFVERELRSRFAHELADLKLKESKHLGKAGTGAHEVAEGGVKDLLEAEPENPAHDLPSSAAGGRVSRHEMEGDLSAEKVAELEKLEDQEVQVNTLLSGVGESDQQKRLADEREQVDRQRRALMAQEATLREKEKEYAVKVTKWKGFVDNPGKTKRRV